MPRPRRLAFCLLAIPIVLVLILLASLAVLPGFIDTEATKERLLREVETRTGAIADYSSAELRYFPFPSLTLINGSLNHSRGVNATFRSLKISPRILHMLIGKLRIGEIHLISPQVIASVPAYEKKGSRPKGGLTPSLKEQSAWPANALASFLSSGISVIIEGGKLELRDPEEILCGIEEFQGRVAGDSGQVDVQVHCASNLWQVFSFQGQFDGRTGASKGEITLGGFRPHAVFQRFFPESDLDVADSLINLGMTFQRKGEGQLEATFKASVPVLKLFKDHGEVVIKGDGIEGTLRADKKRTELVLARSSFDSPRASLSGRFAMDFDPKYYRLEVRGTDLDAAGVGEVFLAVAGDNRTIQRIFEIVRGGLVPEIEFTAQSRFWKDLHKTENFVIKGSMAGGRISVPKALLDVEDAAGEVVISQGILEGRRLQGRSGGSLGRDGSLTVGFKKDAYGDSPFRLDIELDADLGQLPPVLERVVESREFLHEVGLIQEISGRAKGRLLLGESFKAVKTRVAASEFNIAGEYQRIPYPVKVQGKDFVYEGSFVGVGALEGTLGKSLLSGVSGSIDWKEESTLKISSASRCDVYMDEVYSWLLSYDNLKKVLKNFPSIRGFVQVGEITLDGPTRRPGDWRFHGKGTVENLSVKTVYAPGPLLVKTGSVEADEKQLTAKDCSASLLETPLVVSGTLRDLWKDLSEADLTLSGNVSIPFNRWLMDLLPGKRYLRLRAPYSVSKGKFLWNKGQERIDFSGNLATQGGTVADLDITNTPEGFTVHRMQIVDELSNAKLSTKLLPKTLSIGFGGVLSHTSVDRLIENHPVAGGTIRGTLQALIAMDNLVDSQVTGEFDVEALHQREGPLTPLIVEKASVRGEGKSIFFQGGDISWKQTRTKLDGRVDLIEDQCRLDLNLAAERLNWDEIAGDGDESKREPLEAQEQNKRKTTFTGTVRVKAQSFSHGKTQWEPFQAEIQMDRDQYTIGVKDSRLCGVPVQGSLKISGRDVELNASPSAKQDNLDGTLTCLWNKKDLVTGAFDLSGDLSARGTREVLSQDGLTRAMKGSLDFKAKGGRIYRFGLLSKILSMLNVTEIYRGKLPDLVTEGFEYDTIKARGNLENGKLHLDEFTIDAPSMKMFWEGDVDLVKNEVNLTLLVAPLRTFDRVIDNVPLLGNVLGGSMISIPVQVTGDLNDATVIPLSPSAVGSKLLGHVKRVLQLPFKVIQPLQQGKEPSKP